MPPVKCVERKSHPIIFQIENFVEYNDLFQKHATVTCHGEVDN